MLPVCVVGVGGEWSEVVSGVVVDLAPQMLSVVQSIDKPVRMMVSNTASVKEHKTPALFPSLVPSSLLSHLYRTEGGQVKAWGQREAG